MINNKEVGLNSAREKQVEISKTLEKIREQINKNRARFGILGIRNQPNLHQNEENFDSGNCCFK